MPQLQILDWVTPHALVLSLVGRLDAVACSTAEFRIRQLVRQWPGIRVVVDLAGVTQVDSAAFENLCLTLVAIRVSGPLALASPSAACQPTLKQLNLAYEPFVSVERPIAGVTA